ncbi:MAG TPA: hypothetical protein VMI31_05065 [Fimbriimonadaceae bacterium]|nr:hypothetical protein [Fimbriimonadaceae bacterium]
MARASRRPRPRRRILLLAGFALILALLTVDYFAYPYGRYLTGRSFNRGQNGLWLRYTWYFGEQPPGAVQRLAERLRSDQIAFAYFHVRSLKPDGSLEFRYPSAAQLTRTIREAKIKAIAWVYVPATVRLTDPVVRAKAVDQARWLTGQCGFDGVQWDYEPCPSGDPGFLDLLDATRSALPNSLISVAAPVWYPWPLGRYGWLPDYFRQVESRCDQIAVMGYDTGFFTPRSYEWLIAQQPSHIPRVASCRVLMGLPTYIRGGRSHNPRAENLKLALKGVRDSAGVDGVALFADYTTDSVDWNWYRQAWLSR